MNRYLYSIILLLFIVVGCDDPTVPKPRAYFRIDLPQKSYSTYISSCPFSFEYPVYSRIIPYTGSNRSNDCWLNIEFPQFKGTLHLSYFPIHGDLVKHMEDSRSLVFKHTVKADAIDESMISDPQAKVYGLIYDIQGNAASSCQFYLTDSANHFLRGALYFAVAPNTDSIAPVQEFIRKDIGKLIHTLNWK